jgi:ATP-dependent DNA helicase RecG
VVETVSAFCNAAGGVIEVGVRDDGTPTGALVIGGRTLEGWANHIKRDTDPGQTPSILEAEREGETIVRIRVAGSPIKPVLAYGRALKRVGRTNQRMGSGEVQRLVEQSTGGSWDGRPCPDSSLDDISDGKVGEFVSRAGDARARAMPGSPDEILHKTRLSSDGVPTFAAVLLFGTDPQSHLPQSVVKCARFAGTRSTEFIDERTFYGDLFQQVEETYEFALRHISKAITVGDRPQREEHWEYPRDAVRELLINAICHRDYQHTGNVQLRIYDDRLEVWTPGGLPQGVTPEMLRREHASVPRNPRIAGALFLTGYIEQWGSGTLRAIESCRQAGIGGPEFEEEGGMFVARMRMARRFAEAALITLGMNARQIRAIAYVEEGGEITNAAYCEVNGVSRQTATNELRAMVDAGVLGVAGKGRARRYVLSGVG